jgi:murein DD-endopeptidase MepM/ murein hydrolase activator NlpD
MTEEFQEIAPKSPQGDEPAAEPTPTSSTERPRTSWLEALARLGLGEVVMRIGTNVLTLLAIAGVVWLIASFYKTTPAGAAQALGPTATPQVDVSSIPQVPVSQYGIGRMANIHTIIPNRPRDGIVKYTVVAGDTVIGIAQKFSLKPESVLFANNYTLYDNPENLSPGQVLNILPVDGAYYQWHDGDGLNGVAKVMNVKPEDIINYSPNQIDAASVGDYSHPNIKTGTWLVIPGGTRDLVTFGLPTITRSSPAVARVAGSGACGSVTDGAVGTGTFIWPSANHTLSGYDYSAIHRGIDIAGNIGEAVWAIDAGVIVYAGWNEYGYGNMIMIDHGNGWQSLYAHLSSIKVLCGQSVDQGTLIGAIGSTGHSSGAHLHFEMMHSIYAKVNPWDFLPPP